MNRQTSTISLTAMALILLGSIATTAFHTGTMLPKAEAQTSIILGGTVKNSSGVPIQGANVYIEGYKTTSTYSNWKAVATDSSGAWSVSIASGYTYTVMASKYGYNRAHYGTQITQSNSAIHLQINPQNTNTLDIYVAGDEEFRNAYGDTWGAVAWNKIVNKESSFWKANYNIQFSLKGNSGTAWNSPNGVTDCTTLRSDAKSDTGWSAGQYNNADILVAYTKQSGMTPDGCADVPGSGTPHPHPASIIGDYNAYVSAVTTHEMVHNYGFVYSTPSKHHNTYYACTMGIGPAALDYDQLDPNLDSEMAIGGSAKRNWY